jgi:lipopolysaccharide/colanic/teichoic acid biosynthesis glycosyltransferase
MSTDSMPRANSPAADCRKGNDRAAARPLGTADYLSNFFPPKPWYEQGTGRSLDEAGYQRIKRVLDIVLCISGLPFVLTILGLCAIAIKLDSSGPVFFAQLRTGRGGRRFRMFKLRTMVQNAHELKAKYMHLNELSYPDFKISNDPRMTRLGRILRKTSLDELPEIFNVLRGEMPLVGPRPTSFGADTYSLWHTARLDISPGITGLWQVSGRSELGFDERLRLDIAYIRNRSLWLDIKILFRTIGAVVTGRGAN